MRSLEITPLENKKLTVYLIEKEYYEPFWLIEPPSNGTPSKTLTHLFRPSIAFCEFLKKLIKKVNPDLATEELGMRSSKEFHENNVLAQLFHEKDIPFFSVDIDENARGYLSANIEEKVQARDQVLEALSKLSKNAGELVDREYLVAYGQCPQLELEEKQREASFPIRENWIVMSIMDYASSRTCAQILSALVVSSASSDAFCFRPFWFWCCSLFLMPWAFSQSYEHPTMVFIFASTFEYDRFWGFRPVILLCQLKSPLTVCDLDCSSFGAFLRAFQVNFFLVSQLSEFSDKPTILVLL